MKFTLFLLSLLFILFLLLLLTAPVQAQDLFYVSPSGTGTTCSLASPCALTTAASGNAGAIGINDIVYLRGGTYTMHLNFTLSGTSGNPITFRNYPSERPIIDGYVNTTLNGAINSSVTTITLTNAAGFNNGDTIVIDNGVGFSNGENILLANKSGNTFTSVQRGWDGTTAAAHSNGALVVLGKTIVEVSGSDLRFIGIEVTHSGTQRTSPVNTGQDGPHMRGAGFNLTGARIGIINCVVHDVGNGIFQNASAVNSFVHGCIIYHNGYVSGGLPGCHGLYIQNSSGTFTAAKNVVFSNFNDGLKNLSASGDAINVIFDKDVSFNSGSPVVNTTARARRWNMIIGADAGVVNGCQITDSYLYHKQDTIGTNIKLGYSSGNNGAITLTGNRIMGGTQQLDIDRFNPITITGNIFYVGNNSDPPNSTTYCANYVHTASATVTWDNNTYHDSYFNVSQGNNNDFIYNQGGQVSFASWKSTSGFDTNSTHTGTDANYRPADSTHIITNDYDLNRFFIVIYNWSLASSVNVNLSSTLSSGQIYSIVAVEDLFGSVIASGTYTGGSVAIPMNGTSVSAVVGADSSAVWTPTTTRSEFGVFLLTAAGVARTNGKATVSGKAAIR